MRQLVQEIEIVQAVVLLLQVDELEWMTAGYLDDYGCLMAAPMVGWLVVQMAAWKAWTSAAL